jgi:hypothetical protein
MSKYQQVLNALECADQHDYETAQSAALAIRALESENQKLTDCLRRLLIAVTMRMGADAPTTEDRLELSNAHQQAEAALAVQRRTPMLGKKVPMFAGEWDKMIDGMFDKDVRSLCHLLLLKRCVDGGHGRVWDASKHLEYEDLITETLVRMNVPSAHQQAEKALAVQP